MILRSTTLLVALAICILAQQPPCNLQETDDNIPYVTEQMNKIFREATTIPSNAPSMCVNYGKTAIGNVEALDGGISEDEQLTAHFVCSDRKHPKRKLFVGAKLNIKDRVKGSRCAKPKNVKDCEREDQYDTNEIELLESTYKICGADEKGHIIARRHGGTARLYNLFAQNRDLNRRIWEKIDKEIDNFLNEEPNKRRGEPVLYVGLWVGFLYQDLGSPLRPSHIFYQVNLVDTRVHEENPVRRIHGYLQNEDHTGLEMGVCLGTGVGGGVSEYRFVYGSDAKFQRYYDQKSCSVVKPRPADFYKPQ